MHQRTQPREAEPVRRDAARLRLDMQSARDQSAILLDQLRQHEHSALRQHDAHRHAGVLRVVIGKDDDQIFGFAHVYYAIGGVISSATIT